MYSVAASAVCLAVLSACGGSDTPEQASPEASTTEATTAAAPEPKDCATNLVVTEVATGTATTLTEAGAVSLGGGAAYTMYAADFPVDTSSANLAFEPEVPATATSPRSP